MSEGDNLPGWTGQPGVQEAWFLTMTDPRGGDGYWIRFSILAPQAGPVSGGVWFARFGRTDPGSTFGIHTREELYDLSVARDTFDVKVGDSSFRSGHTKGSVKGEGHSVSWDLEFPTGQPTYNPLPAWASRPPLLPARAVGPNPQTLVSGSLRIDGEIIEVRDVHGYQGHVFGDHHPQRWAWAHCGDFVGEDAVLTALTTQAKRGPVTTPYITSVGLLWDGKEIRLRKVSRRRDFGLGTWRVDLGDRRHRLTGRIEADTGSLVRARYEDPDGSFRYCHNSEIASCRLALFERKAAGFEEVALLESRGTTHAEWTGLTPAAVVEREHVEVSS